MKAANPKWFQTILTHSLPHCDEICALWILRKFGEEKFPGISEARIVFCEDMPLDKTPEEYEREGVILLGVGGGRYDEHPTTNGVERKQGDCAATLIAKSLGVENDPVLEKILKFVTANDLKSAGHPFDIAHLATLLYGRYPNQPEKVIGWVVEGLEAKYHEQLNFFTATKEAYEELAQVEEIAAPGGRILKMVTVVSDDDQVGKYARSIHGANAAVVIQKRSTGNVQVYTNKRFGITMYDVAQMLRYEEQRLKGVFQTTNWKDLGVEGKVKGAEEWFFHYGGQMLLNGSLTVKGVPPTCIPLDQIQKIVRIGVDPRSFEGNHSIECKQGRCTSTRVNSCEWFAWGLHRCRKMRFNMACEA